METKTTAEAKSASRPNPNPTSGTREIDAMYDMKMLQMKDLLSKAQNALDLKEVEAQDNKEEIARLRSRTIDMKAGEEQLRCQKKLYEEMEELYHRSRDELDDTSTALSMAREETQQVRLDLEAEIEAQKVVIDRLNNSYESVLHQHSSMLHEVHKYEGTAKSEDELLVDVLPPMEMSASQLDQRSAAQTTAKDTRVYEQKISNLRQKLADSETKLRDLQETPKKMALLVDDLRAKNETIRDLKRTIADMNKQSDASTTSNHKERSNDELVANLYDEIRRLQADLDRARKASNGKSDASSSSSLQKQLLLVQQEKEDLIEELKDLQSRGVAASEADGNSMSSEISKVANFLVESYSQVLIDIHGNIKLNESVFHGMTNVKSALERMLKLDDNEVLQRDNLVDLLEVLEVYFNDDDDEEEEG